MSEVNAIAGSLFSYRTLADGGLRLTVDLNENESEHFHKLFPGVHRPVAIAPLNPVEMSNSMEPMGQYGEQAKALKLSAFLSYLDVWKAAGSDEQFLAFVRTQKCIARSGAPCGGPIQAAHVWRLKDDFGKGIKGDYAAVALCAYHHTSQHNYGEDAIGGREYMEKRRVQTVAEWVWSVIKKDIGVESMADAEPAKVLAWAQRRGVEKYLPSVYREAA